LRASGASPRRFVGKPTPVHIATMTEPPFAPVPGRRRRRFWAVVIATVLTSAALAATLR
jgi:hypothetical protein